jgi:hypothetical protein
MESDRIAFDAEVDRLKDDPLVKQIAESIWHQTPIMALTKMLAPSVEVYHQEVATAVAMAYVDAGGVQPKYLMSVWAAVVKINHAQEQERKRLDDIVQDAPVKGRG